MGDIINAYVYDMIYTIIYVLLCNLFASVLLVRRGKFSAKLHMIYLVIWTGTVFTVSTVLDSHIIIKMLTIFLLDVFFLCILYHLEFNKIIGLAFLFQAICFMTDYSIYALVNKMTVWIEMGNNSEQMIEHIISISGLLLVADFVIWVKNKLGAEKLQIFTGKEWIKFMVVPAFSIISILALILNFEDNLTGGQEITILFIVLGLALINIFVFGLILDIVGRESQRKKEELVLEHARQTEKLYLQEKKGIEQMQRQRHEYRNQMLAIAGLLEEKEYGRIEEHIKNYCGEIEQMNRFDTNNPVVNAILNYKYMDALNRNILMLVRFNDLSGIPINDFDLISVFANLLDNAIEGAEKYNGKRRMIKVKIVLEEEEMFASVCNVWDGKLIVEDGKILSTKHDKTSHGFGIETVKALVEKYDGTYVIQNDEDEFRFVISIPVF